MSSIPIYLWKEWREQRTSLGILALGLLIVAIVTFTHLGWSVRETAGAMYWLPSLCGLGTVAAVGSDLFANDAKAGRAQFLQRVPAGIGSAYWSKLLFFLLALGASILYGILLTYLSFWIVGGERLGFGPPDLYWRQAGVASLLSLWVFAFSTWVPSSALAVPVTMIIWSALVFPVVLLAGRIYPNVSYVEYRGWILPTSVALGAILSGRMTFASRARGLCSRPRIVISSLGLAGLSLSPVYVPLAIDLVSWLRRPYTLSGAMIGEGAHVAFLQLSSARFAKAPPKGSHGTDHLARSAWRLDLDTLELEELGPGILAPLPQKSTFWMGPWDAKRVRVWNTLETSEGLLHFDIDVYDLDSGQLLKTGAVADESRRTAYWASSDSEVSSETDTFPSGFGVRIAPRPPFAPGSLVTYRSRDGAQLDLTLQGVFKFPVSPDGSFVQCSLGDLDKVRILPGGFLRHEQNRWLLFDERTNTFEAREALKPGETLCGLLSDGTLFTQLEGTLFVVNLENGVREPIQSAQGEALDWIHRVQFVGSWDPDLGPLDIADPLAVSLASRDPQKSQLGRIDFAKRELRPFPEHQAHTQRIVWAEAEEVVFIEDGARLLRVALGRSAQRLLFNAADL